MTSNRPDNIAVQLNSHGNVNPSISPDVNALQSAHGNCGGEKIEMSHGQHDTAQHRNAGQVHVDMTDATPHTHTLTPTPALTPTQADL